MSSTAINKGYDPEHEARIAEYRRKDLALVVQNIHFGTEKEVFEAACREKLANPDGVTFSWARSLNDIAAG